MVPVYITLAIAITLTTQAQCNNVTTNNTTSLKITTPASWTGWAFKDYLDKFNPTRVWEEISKANARRGIKNDLEEEFETIFKGIDQTEELLSLKVPNGDPKVIVKDGRRWQPSSDAIRKILQDGRRRASPNEAMKNISKGFRRWEPPGDIVSYTYDRFSLNRRFIELMKQAIYQARNKMVIMQALRQKYNKNSVYKMGFLMSKTDQTCKTFARFTYKAFAGCYYIRIRSTRLNLLELLEAYERVINLWFDVELLVDLVRLNDDNCERMLNQVLTNRKQAWKFVD